MSLPLDRLLRKRMKELGMGRLAACLGYATSRRVPAKLTSCAEGTSPARNICSRGYQKSQL